MLKILFVCTGNTCRSPMSEYALKSILKKREVKAIKVSSAGISAVDGDKMNEKALIALKKRNISAKRFVSKRVTADLAKSQNAIVCMTAEQKRAFVGFNNVYCMNELTGLGDVPDPFGKSQEVYDETLEKIISACEKIAELLIKENIEIQRIKELKQKEKAEKQARKAQKIKQTKL